MAPFAVRPPRQPHHPPGPGPAPPGPGGAGGPTGPPALLTVNTPADTVDANSAVTSLREAISQANSQAGDDTIGFSVTGTINLTGALPELSSNLDGQLTVRRDSGGEYSIFTVYDGDLVYRLFVVRSITLSIQVTV
jgi:CSLREA domain-containing protein